MKKFDQFVNETSDYQKSQDEFNAHRLRQRKIVKPFIQKYIVDKYTDGNMHLMSVKPWKDDTDIILKVSGIFSLRDSSADELIKKAESLANIARSIKKVIEPLNIDFKVRQMKGSYDVEINIYLPNSYFEDNKDLIASLEGISKFNL